MPDYDQLAAKFGGAGGGGGQDKYDLLAQKFTGTAAVTQEAPSLWGTVKQSATDLAGGAVRGAGSIGSTILWPVDKAVDVVQGDRTNGLSRNEERRMAIDRGLTELIGSNPDSLTYKAGKLGAEIAGTMGAGGVLARGATMIPGLASKAPSLVTAIRSGGFTTGAPIANPLLNLATRTAGGSITGGVSAGLVNPDEAKAGAVIGGAMPGAVKVAGLVGNKLASTIDSGAERLMQSAIKPTIKQLKTGDAATAVRTLLDYGINPTAGGVAKLRAKIGDLNTEIADQIANSPATIDKQAVIGRLGDVRKVFGNQVSPTADLNAIQGVADDFLAHPAIPGSQIPVQLAQDLKQGTYKVLSKKYGQMGGAEVEAQKGLARGLKEEIANAVPEISALNAEESRLITTLNVAERRALMEMNKNPMGLASLAKNPVSWAAFMADKSALFKSLAARMLNSSTSGVRAAAPALENALNRPLLRNSALVIGANE